jgi:hypothetical protein
MAKTYQDIIDEARVLLQDTDSGGYRLENTALLAMLNRAMNELARLRPEAFWDLFDVDDIIVPEVVETDADPDSDPDEVDPDEDGEVALTDDFNLPMMFYNPLVYFVVSSAEIVDDEFTNDGRAAMLMQQFRAQVLSL